MDFIARLRTVHGYGNQSQRRAQGRHKDGVQTVGRAAQDCVAQRGAPLAQGVIVRHQQHAVARGYAHERYEAYDGRNIELARGEAQYDDTSYQCKRHV